MKIYNLGQIPENKYSDIGGKAKGLDLLIKNNFNVPKGFLITDIDLIDEKMIYDTFDSFNFKMVSVRSSASNEDLLNKSNAGQFDTFLFVERNSLIESIKKCVDSINDTRAIKYQEHFSLDNNNQMNVIVEEMIDSTKAGVIFTSNIKDLPFF